MRPLPSSLVFENFIFTFYAGLFSHHLRPSDRMINAQVEEAQQRFAILEDVDEDSFKRFVEWAYKAYYKAANSCSLVRPLLSLPLLFGDQFIILIVYFAGPSGTTAVGVFFDGP